MLDEFITLLRVLFYLLAFIFIMTCMPFVICHVADNWAAPEYPHSGFTPDCPTWHAPADDVENTLPPTYYLASDSEL